MLFSFLDIWWTMYAGVAHRTQVGVMCFVLCLLESEISCHSLSAKKTWVLCELYEGTVPACLDSSRSSSLLLCKVYSKRFTGLLSWLKTLCPVYPRRGFCLLPWSFIRPWSPGLGLPLGYLLGVDFQLHWWEEKLNFGTWMRYFPTPWALVIPWLPCDTMITWIAQDAPLHPASVLCL